MKKILIVICSITLFFLISGCSKKTSESEVDKINYYETEEVTNYVKIEMADGDIMLLELYPDIAPITVANFQKLVSEKFYDNLTFHRIAKNFMIQGGAPKATSKIPETIKGEFGINSVTNTLSHKRGVISMARNDISYDSASSQFFICHADVPSFDGSYAAFGELIAGFDTLDKLANVKVNGETQINQPKIKSIRFITIEA